ncbi:MAG TPA: ABC transporter permease [Gaiellaceae bacterium]|nr:ABC transporter permease [Gaiellaceae bacterium]
MLTYIVRRLLYAIPVLAVSSFLIFVFVSTTTDPLEAIKMNPRASQHSIHLVEHAHHLDRPVVIRYGYWVRDVFTRQFGTTILTSRPILPDIKRVLSNTVQLVIAAELLTLLLAICIGVYSAIRQYSVFDYSMTTLSFLGLAIPTFWLGLIFQIIFVNVYVKWHVRIFYVASLSSINPGHGFHFFIDRVQHLVLPVLTLAIIGIAGYSRFMRASMLEVINADYVRTARAKGLIERRVILKHAFRNALIPLMTLAAIDFGTFFGGAVVTETIYGLDGMGLYFINSLTAGETYNIMAWLLITATMVVLFNLLADIILGFLDPRIRLD